ncbi:hypothetical protein, partial [Phaeovulum sp.]|uniref:hypothetical protein n=1 Tax=Phaeovulum sp. TaxID=2934796 RepID=UPI00356A7D43
MKFISDFSFTSAPHRPRGDWHPVQLFDAGARGAVFDPSDLAAMFQDSAGLALVTALGQPISKCLDQSGGGNHASQAVAAARPQLARYPASGIRNVATGAGAMDSVTYWPASITSGGVTATKQSSGVDTDGLEYATWSIAGTASADAYLGIYAYAHSRAPASVGQTWTCSAFVQLVSGSAPPAGSGLVIGVTGEKAPSTSNESATYTTGLTDAETLFIVSKTLSAIGTNQVRANPFLKILSGATVNCVLKVKALQLNTGAERGAYQHNLSPYDITEAGQRDVWAICRDGVDDALPATLPDLGSDATIWYATASGGAT